MNRWIVRLWCSVVKPPGWVRMSGGFFVKVRRLGLYELDAVKFDDPGPFTYEYQTGGGKTKEAVYDISQWPESPKPPAIPQEICDPQSMEAALWKVYNIYQSALLQRIKQVEAAEIYAHDVARYILAHCVSDRELIQTPGDYEHVYNLAITPEVSLTDINEALNTTFKASFDGQPIIEQLLRDKSGSGKMDAIRLWANQARQAWGLDRAAWAGLSLRERAEMVVGVKLPGWMEALEWQKQKEHNV